MHVVFDPAYHFSHTTQSSNGASQVFVEVLSPIRPNEPFPKPCAKDNMISQTVEGGSHEGMFLHPDSGVQFQSTT